ncbi:hypothetical protein WMY93_023746 [Mugilogobius chulae]|uniref:Zinc finger BED domain-containing 1-like protein n=1 Tax=Mugilogobius chulae TaxID=88201 RepID=A0AAW0NA65_9GOBI
MAHSSPGKEHPYCHLIDSIKDGTVKFFNPEKLSDARYDKLPLSMRVLLESAIRNCDGFYTKTEDVENILDWQQQQSKAEVPFSPARVLLQDFTPAPAHSFFSCPVLILGSEGNNIHFLRDFCRIDPRESPRMGKSSSRSPSPSTSAHAGSAQPTMLQALAKTTKYKKDSAQWRKRTESITNYLAKEMVSFKTVDKKSFKNMLATFDPNYDLPGRKYFSQTAIPQLYSRVKQQVQAVLSHAESYSITTDMWSSVNMTPYMSVTAHFINEDWELISKCLETSYFPESHTAVNLATALGDVLHDWELDEEKLAAITTDNAANIAAAVRTLKWPWINCFGHNLHLTVTNGVESERAKTDRAIRMCREINGAFSHSWHRKKELKKKQTELGLPEHTLITDCATRWGSKNNLQLTWQDTDVLQAVYRALKPVSEFTDILSGERYVTSSSVIPMLSHCRNDVLFGSDEDVELTKRIKAAILQKLDAKYEDRNVLTLLRKCTFLDPRYKGGFEADETALREITALLLEEMLAHQQDVAGEESGVPSEETEDEVPKKKKSLGCLLQKTPAPSRSRAFVVRAEEELASYGKEQVSPGDGDPLLCGIPAMVDLAAMRDAVAKHGVDPSLVNPKCPTDLIVDHSLQIDFSKCAIQNAPNPGGGDTSSRASSRPQARPAPLTVEDRRARVVKPPAVTLLLLLLLLPRDDLRPPSSR